MTVNIGRAKFHPGKLVCTVGASRACSDEQLSSYLAQHVSGDWGACCPEDAALNDEALANGGRLHSAYPIDPAKPCAGWGENTLWIITEADRSVTTFLLPADY